MKPIYLDNSTMQSLVCSTKTFLRHGLHLTSRESLGVLESGSAGHEALAMYFRGEPADVALKALLPYKTWSAREARHGDLQPRLRYENLFAVCAAWMKGHPLDALPVRVPSKKMVEVGFQATLSEKEQLVLTGRLDVLVEDSTGNLAPFDHKFTGRLASNWVEKFRIESQMSAYMWATSKHTGKRVTRAYINAVELSLLPSTESRECKDHKTTYRMCGALHLKTKIFLVNRTPEMLARWRWDAIEMGKRFRALKQLAEDTGPKALESLPMEGAFFNACQYCEFRHFCAHNRPVESLNDLFVKDEWDPLAHSLGKPRRK